MALYKSTSGESASWHAANRIVIDNPHNSPPSATFLEVRRHSIDGVLIGETPTNRDVSMVVGEVPVNIPVVNPDTDEPIPGAFITDHQLGLYLRSAYLYRARLLDEAEGEV